MAFSKAWLGIYSDRSLTDEMRIAAHKSEVTRRLAAPVL
jgi:hypothetical protein